MTNVEQKNIAVAQVQAHSRSKAESPLLGDGAFFAYLTKLLPIQAAEPTPSLDLHYPVPKDAQIAALTTSKDGKSTAGLRLPFAIPDAEPIKNESVAVPPSHGLLPPGSIEPHSTKGQNPAFADQEVPPISPSAKMVPEDVAVAQGEVSQSAQTETSNSPIPAAFSGTRLTAALPAPSSHTVTNQPGVTSVQLNNGPIADDKMPSILTNSLHATEDTVQRTRSSADAGAQPAMDTADAKPDPLGETHADSPLILQKNDSAPTIPTHPEMERPRLRQGPGATSQKMSSLPPQLSPNENATHILATPQSIITESKFDTAALTQIKAPPSALAADFEKALIKQDVLNEPNAPMLASFAGQPQFLADAMSGADSPQLSGKETGVFRPNPETPPNPSTLSTPTSTALPQLQLLDGPIPVDAGTSFQHPMHRPNGLSSAPETRAPTEKGQGVTDLTTGAEDALAAERLTHSLNVADTTAQPKETAAQWPKATTTHGEFRPVAEQSVATGATPRTDTIPQSEGINLRAHKPTTDAAIGDTSQHSVIATGPTSRENALTLQSTISTRSQAVPVPISTAHSAPVTSKLTIQEPAPQPPNPSSSHIQTGIDEFVAKSAPPNQSAYRDAALRSLPTPFLQATVMEAAKPATPGAFPSITLPPTDPESAGMTAINPAQKIARQATFESQLPMTWASAQTPVPQATQPQTAAIAPHASVPIAQLVDHIKDHSKLGKPASLELTLTPEDLGKIRLFMTPDGDKIRVVIQAERPETMELLKRNTEGFTAELRQSGYASASFSFGGWGNPPSSQQNQDQTQPTNSGSTPTGDATEKPAIPQQFAPPHKSSGLDLRI